MPPDILGEHHANLLVWVLQQQWERQQEAVWHRLARKVRTLTLHDPKRIL